MSETADPAVKAVVAEVVSSAPGGSGLARSSGRCLVRVDPVEIAAYVRNFDIDGSVEIDCSAALDNVRDEVRYLLNVLGDFLHCQLVERQYDPRALTRGQL